jgi:hypothetical protein
VRARGGGNDAVGKIERFSAIRFFIAISHRICQRTLLIFHGMFGQCMSSRLLTYNVVDGQLSSGLR